MPTLWLFDIESHEQRYTSEWKTELPSQLRRAIKRRTRKIWKLKVVTGGSASGNLSSGAFVNFTETNIYKSNQIVKFARHVMSGDVKDGDRLLFADAWHPGVLQCRYIADLHPIKFTIDVMWHAGSYDRFDLLGQNKQIPRWSIEFERSVFRAASRNYFATEFHQKMFLKTVRPGSGSSARIVGWPMEYLRAHLQRHVETPKSTTLLFPHRLSAEKQPDLIRPLQALLPQYQIVKAHSRKLPKSIYRNMVGKAAAILSFSQQETLGISIYEGLICGAVPIVPRRLSYSELYPSYCYPDKWTQSPKEFSKHAQKLASFIDDLIQNHDPKMLSSWARSVGNQFFDGGALYVSVLR